MRDSRIFVILFLVSYVFATSAAPIRQHKDSLPKFAPICNRIDDFAPIMSHHHPITVLSHIQARQLLDAHQADERAVDVSLDLGMSHQALELNADGVILPTGRHLDWAHIHEVAESSNVCFQVVSATPEQATVEHVTVEKIQRFSPEFNRLYTLMPASESAECPPTMLISGIPMHRIKETDPQRDTREKIRAIGRFTGPVLDTATGLGYTAIAAAQRAEHVTTIELDPTVLEICRRNPWSQELFTRSNITQLVGDAADVVAEQDADTFTQIIHDPPMFSLAGHLYSTEFYRDLLRIMQRRGRLFHYIGNPDSKSGRSTTTGVMRRLQEAGFVRIGRRPRAFGVVAHKP